MVPLSAFCGVLAYVLMGFLCSHSAAHQRVQPWWLSWSPYQFVRNKIRSTVFRINGPLLLLLSSWLADTGTIPMFDSISQPRACFYISVSQASLGHIAIALEKGPNAQSISSSLCLRGTTDVSQTRFSIFDQASLQGLRRKQVASRLCKAWCSCWILSPCKQMFFLPILSLGITSWNLCSSNQVTSAVCCSYFFRARAKRALQA
jgi:hypothetical protein